MLTNAEQKDGWLDMEKVGIPGLHVRTHSKMGITSQLARVVPFILAGLMVGAIEYLSAALVFEIRHDPSHLWVRDLFVGWMSKWVVLIGMLGTWSGGGADSASTRHDVLGKTLAKGVILASAGAALAEPVYFLLTWNWHIYGVADAHTWAGWIALSSPRAAVAIAVFLVDVLCRIWVARASPLARLLACGIVGGMGGLGAAYLDSQIRPFWGYGSAYGSYGPWLATGYTFGLGYAAASIWTGCRRRDSAPQ